MAFLLRAVEDAAHAVGVDKVVHAAVGKQRLVERNGQVNNPIAWGVQAVEHVAHETHIDKVVHHFTRGERVMNKDGTFNPKGALRALKNSGEAVADLPKLASKAIGEALQHFQDQLKELKRKFDKKSKEFVDALKKAWDAMKKAIEEQLEKLRDSLILSVVQEIYKKVKPTLEILAQVYKALEKNKGLFVRIAKNIQNQQGDATKQLQSALRALDLKVKGSQYDGIAGFVDVFLRNMAKGVCNHDPVHGSIGVSVGVAGGYLGRGSLGGSFCVAASDIFSGQLPKRAAVLVNGGVGFEAGAEANSSQQVFLSIKDPADQDGLGFDVGFSAECFAGFDITMSLDISLPWDSPGNQLSIYPSALAIGPAEGFGAGLSIEATFASKVWELKANEYGHQKLSDVIHTVGMQADEEDVKVDDEENMTGEIVVGMHHGKCPKIVKLPSAGLLVSNVPVNGQHPSWRDRFSVEVDGDVLKVYRMDAPNSGWGQNLRLRYNSKKCTGEIVVGSSGKSPKIVKLPSAGLLVSNVPVNGQHPSWRDRFSVEVDGDVLKVYRTDAHNRYGGWGQHLRLSYTK